MAEGEPWIYQGSEVPVPKLQYSLGDFLFQRLRHHGKNILQVDGVTEEQVSADQVLSRAVAVAQYLQKCGVGKGDIVTVALHNSLDVSYVLLGTLFTGATYAPIHPDLAKDDLHHMVSLLSPRVVFCTQKGAMWGAVPPEAMRMEVREGNATWEELRRGASPAAVDAFKPEESVDLDGPAAILGSSGTSGKPKGVIHTHNSLHHFCVQEGGRAKKDVIMMITSNSWISGFTMTLTNIYTGSRMVIFREFNVDAILEAIQKHRVTYSTIPSSHVAAIAKHPNIEKYDVSSLKNAYFGGSCLSPVLRKMAEKRLTMRLLHLYGQTECMMAVVPGPLSDNKYNTVGCAAMNAQVKVIDPETGKTVAPHVEGEICVKSPNTFRGYYKNAEATAANIDNDGWVHSGDAGYLDEDGYLYISDRYKEMIKYRGFQIAPADIEAILASHENVREVAVVGIEHDEDQERPVAIIVREDSPKARNLTSEDIIKFVEERSSGYKQLYGGAYFTNKIPKTVTGKIQRRELRNIVRYLSEERSKVTQIE